MNTDAPTPLLSAIVPNYNHADHIATAIAALLSQDLPPDEIIIIDDASTDHSLSVIETLVKNGRGIVRLVRHETNQGAIAALNRGLQEAKGKYIYFGSADDITFPNLFRTLIVRLNSQPAAALACGETRLTGERGRLTGYRPAVRPANDARYFPPETVRQMLRTSDHWVLTGASVYRRDMLAAVGGLDPALGSFADGFASKTLIARHGFCFVPEIVAEWRIDDAGYSRSTAGSLAIIQRAIGKISAKIADDPAFPLGYEYIFARRTRFAVCRIAAQAKPVNREMINHLGPSYPLDKIVLAFIYSLERLSLAYYPLLIWLTIRLWPVSPAHVLITGIIRSMNLSEEERQRRGKT